MSSTETMKALVVCHWPKLNRILNLCRFRPVGQGLASVSRVPIPTPTDTQLLVEVHAVALNPTDWKHIDFLSPAGSIVGCDYAGVVKKVSKVNPRNFKVGDRVAGMVHGGLYKDTGSFAEYLVVESGGVFRVPDELSYREAATLGVSSATAMQALNHNLSVPWIGEATETSSGSKPTVLIYAGSTASGLLAIQLAKLGGYQVVTTCSPHSFDLVKSYGATSAFDYHSASALQDITTAYPDIRIAMDCIAEGGSNAFCCKVLAANGGKVISLFDRGPSKVPGVEVKSILAYTLGGKEFQWFAPIGPKFPAVPEDKAALFRFYDLLPSVLGKGVRAPPIEVVEGGWDGLLPGLDLLRKGKVSGKKVVIELK